MKEKLKVLLNISGTDQDALLDMVLEQVTGFIRDDLHWPKAKVEPAGLQALIVEIAAAYYRARGYGRLGEGEQIGGDIVKRVTEGDTTVEYDASGNMPSVVLGTDFIRPWLPSLAAYRRPGRW